MSSFAYSQDDKDNLIDNSNFIKIANNIANLVNQNNSPHGLRVVKPDELFESRGYTEDSIRMYLLADYSEPEYLPKLRQLLNSKWNHDTVQGLWSIDAYTDNGKMSGRTIRLLLFASKKYKCDVFDDVQIILDDVFTNLSLIRSNDDIDYNLILYLQTAFNNYGNPELIKESFWGAIKNEEIGQYFIDSIGSFGNEETLKRLIEFKNEHNWANDFNVELLNTAIKKLKDKYPSETSRRKQDKKSSINDLENNNNSFVETANNNTNMSSKMPVKLKQNNKAIESNQITNIINENKTNANVDKTNNSKYNWTIIISIAIAILLGIVLLIKYIKRN